jgi:hypothetical protein
VANGNIEVNVVILDEDKLRAIIREEISKAIEPGAIRPPYLPAVAEPLPYWQNPTYAEFPNAS